MILAIDPGNKESAFVVLDKDLKPIKFAKTTNISLLCSIKVGEFDECDNVAIEMIASYGMAVGESVFDTCVWIGRFYEALNDRFYPDSMLYIYRKDEKMNLCQSMKAKDSNIRQALIDRFAKHDFKNGKGTKSNPDWFYGFKADIWQAYAVGITYYDMYLKE